MSLAQDGQTLIVAYSKDCRAAFDSTRKPCEMDGRSLRSGCLLEEDDPVSTVPHLKRGEHTKSMLHREHVAHRSPLPALLIGDLGGLHRTLCVL
jgi:hypothetical protein